MSIIGLVILLIVLGVLMWLVNTYIPMAQPFKTIVNVVIIIALCLFLLQNFGLLGSFRLGHSR